MNRSSLAQTTLSYNNAQLMRANNNANNVGNYQQNITSTYNMATSDVSNNKQTSAVATHSNSPPILGNSSIGISQYSHLHQHQHHQQLNNHNFQLHASSPSSSSASSSSSSSSYHIDPHLQHTNLVGFYSNSSSAAATAVSNTRNHNNHQHHHHNHHNHQKRQLSG